MPALRKVMVCGELIGFRAERSWFMGESSTKAVRRSSAQRRLLRLHARQREGRPVFGWPNARCRMFWGIHHQENCNSLDPKGKGHGSWGRLAFACEL